MNTDLQKEENVADPQEEAGRGQEPVSTFNSLFLISVLWKFMLPALGLLYFKNIFPFCVMLEGIFVMCVVKIQNPFWLNYIGHYFSYNKVSLFFF